MSEIRGHLWSTTERAESLTASFEAHARTRGRARAIPEAESCQSGGRRATVVRVEMADVRSVEQANAWLTVGPRFTWKWVVPNDKGQSISKLGKISVTRAISLILELRSIVMKGSELVLAFENLPFRCFTQMRSNPQVDTTISDPPFHSSPNSDVTVTGFKRCLHSFRGWPVSLIQKLIILQPTAGSPNGQARYDDACRRLVGTYCPRGMILMYCRSRGTGTSPKYALR
nr:hypothetical protein CFP56_70017 [Quercus suber]